jgi:class 3 adenylate cyclase/ActR/RegA family two-component response regulator
LFTRIHFSKPANDLRSINHTVMNIPEKPTILYVDDEEDNLIVFKSAFRRDFNVLTTTSPTEALEIVAREEVPVVISDQRMPLCTGVELFRKMPENIGIVRIILTGFSDVEVIIKAINNCNIYRYLTKPWDQAELKHTLDHAVEKYYMQKSNAQLLFDLKEANEQLEEKVQLRTSELQQEKEKSERLLLNILPDEIAEELKQHGKVKPRRYDNVSIIFLDFVEFTRIAERMPPEALIEELDYYFQAIDTIFSKHGIEKIKTIGDAYLAVGGLPVPDAQHALHTVEGALEILDFINTEKEKRRVAGETAFDIRIGIHSGSVIAGVVGNTKFAFDIWGDDVNIAARLESNGEKGRINVSESTYQLTKDHFRYEHRGKVSAKYKGEIEMYYLANKD